MIEKLPESPKACPSCGGALSRMLHDFDVLQAGQRFCSACAWAEQPVALQVRPFATETPQ